MNKEKKEEKDKLEFHTEEHKCVCKKCGNVRFRVYIKIIIDDAELFCARCGEPSY